MTSTPVRPLTLEALWELPSAPVQVFTRERTRSLPPPARRYLEHAIAEGTPLASAVRLRMHGEIQLKGWLPFTAEQVYRRDRGLVWRANVRMRGCTLSMEPMQTTFLVPSNGTSTWSVFVPFMREATGLDLFFQSAALVPGWNPGNMIVSNAAKAVIGTP